MQLSTRRWCAVLALLTLLMIAALAGCQSSPNGTTQKGTATTGPHATATSATGGTPGTTTASTTPSPTPTPVTACKGTITDIVLPDHAAQVGKTITTGATTTCDYSVPEDVKSVDTFFTTQMKNSGWTLLHDDPNGPNAMLQQYFKAQRFATITITQHGSNTNSTDVTITVESSQ